MNDLAMTVLVGVLTILLFLGLVVLLLVLARDRRSHHRAQLAELRADHAEEMLQVEREVQAQTLSEVGRELHDNVGQLLAVVRLGINRRMHAGPDAGWLDGLKTDVDDVIAEVRKLSHLLDAERWQESSLAGVLGSECDRIRKAGNHAVSFKAVGAEPDLHAGTKLVLFRIFQEAVSNIIRHANAKRIDVRMVSSDQLRLSIADDGEGFDEEEAHGTGIGLANMRRRAALIGYALEIVTRPGFGTTIHIHPK